MLERRPAYDFEDEESLVDRSVSFVREMTARLRDHAGRKWRTTSLNVDIGILRRRRRQWLLALGDNVFARLKGGRALDGADYQEYFDEIRNIDRTIASKELEIAEIEEDESFERSEDEVMSTPAVARRTRPRRVLKRRDPAGALPPSPGTAAAAGEAEPDDEA